LVKSRKYSSNLGNKKVVKNRDNAKNNRGNWNLWQNIIYSEPMEINNPIPLSS